MHNLIIAGVGGQGINALAKIIAVLCQKSGYACQYSVHKGGAQSLGSVYAEMRIATDTIPALGSTIPVGQLDTLIAMDPWEGLRHVSLAHDNTLLWVEKQVLPLFVERQHKQAAKLAASNPIDQLAALPLSIQLREYRNEAMQAYGTPMMANYLAGLDCLSALHFSNTEQFENTFFQFIPAARSHQRSLAI